ncbi:hypothetical protein Dimus_011531 [Dionaea muscipula]
MLYDRKYDDRKKRNKHKLSGSACSFSRVRIAFGGHEQVSCIYYKIRETLMIFQLVFCSLFWFIFSWLNPFDCSGSSSARCSTSVLFRGSMVLMLAFLFLVRGALLMSDFS